MKWTPDWPFCFSFGSLLFQIDFATATFGCGCQSRPICPPPPSCISQQLRQAPVHGANYRQCPPCNCNGGGFISGGTIPINGGNGLAQNFIPAGILSQSVGGGSYAVGPGGGNTIIGGPSLPSASYVSPNSPQFVGGPQLIIPQQTGFGKQDRLTSFVTTPQPHGRHSIRSNRGDDDDVYDEVLPTSGQQVADVSVDSKKLLPYNDVYLKRNRFLRQLRNRALRQFSAKSLTTQIEHEDLGQQSVCNNDKLGRIMLTAMVEDISVSKKLVRKAAELAFDGRKFDVLCANGEFSYSVYAKVFCEATRESGRGDNITCFAFMV